MNYDFGRFMMRAVEPSDIEQLYELKNDPLIQKQLDGFTFGYSMQDLHDWMESGRKRDDQAIWAIYDKEEQRCIGHIGLYRIDLRVGSAELGTFLGNKSYQGKGLGVRFAAAAITFGFKELNLHRIYVTQLANNHTAASTRRLLGFREEGRLRDAQYKDGEYVDVVILSMLRSEYEDWIAKRMLLDQKAAQEEVQAVKS